MFTLIFGFIKNLFGATEAVADAVKQRDGELNAPAMQANAAAAEKAKIADDATKAVADGNLDEIRKEASSE